MWNIAGVTEECFACRNSEAVELAPVTEAIYVGRAWRVAHAFNTSLPGWLVLVPLRHVTTLDAMSEAEVMAMGLLLRRCSVALRELLGCSKTYFMLFAEAEGFSHLHVHVVPRMDWFEPEQAGPGVFSFLGLDESASLPQSEREDLARALRGLLHDDQE